MSFLAVGVRVLNAGIMVLVPLLGALAWIKRTKTNWRLFGIGVVVFIASQVLHIPFNIFGLSPFLERVGLDTSNGAANLVLISLALGLSAGLFEETARYLAYRYWLKDERPCREGVMLGLGHGGVESIIVGVLAFYALAQAFVLHGENLGDYVSLDQIGVAQAQLAAYWNMPWHTVLLGAVERVAALCFHVGASVIVLQALKRKNLAWLGMAILWHALLDAIAVFGVQTWGIYATEACVVAFGGLSLWFAFLLRDEPDEEISPAPLSVPEISLVDFEVKSDELDDSRYG